jgi:hypothetical protein
MNDEETSFNLDRIHKLIDNKSNRFESAMIFIRESVCSILYVASLCFSNECVLVLMNGTALYESHRHSG